MEFTRLKTTGLALIAMLVATGASATSTVNLLASSQSVTQGESFTLTLQGYFPDGIIGGGIDLFFDDSRFAFESLVFDAGLGDDPDLQRFPDILNGELNGIAFGNFDGLTGMLTIAELSFTALATGSGTFLLDGNEGGPPSNPGPFVDLDGNIINGIDFGKVRVSVKPVPVPAALWMFIGAIGWLSAGYSRRQ